jgi:hypothetical protein
MVQKCLWFLLLPLLLLATEPKIPPTEQEEEVRWLASLGLKAPAQPWPLENPFTAPFTRRSLVVPTAWYRNRPQTLRADLFRADVQLLRRVMETAYAGWDIAKTHGWNWDQFFDDWDVALAESGTRDLSLNDAFAPWRKFMQVQLDNHSGPTVGNFATVGHAFSWTALLAKEPEGVCNEVRNAKEATFPIDTRDPAQQPKKAEDRTGKAVQYIVTPHSKGPVKAVHCGTEWIRAEAAWMPEEEGRYAHIRAMAGTEKDVPVFRSISPRIGYIRYPSFSKPAVELTIQMERTLWARVHSEEILIVDLRGNGGGDMRIEALLGWSKFGDAEGKTRLGASCLYPALRWGYSQISALGLTPPISDSRVKSLQAGLDALTRQDAPGCPAKYVEKPATWNYVEHHYPSALGGKTRLLALVDDFCGSDCEGAVEAIAAVPGSVVAGVNTFGVAQYIQPGYFVLPNTRLPFRIALGTADHYGDGRSFDGYGFDVDIVLPSKDDQSPENIVKLAERLLENK